MSAIDAILLVLVGMGIGAYLYRNMNKVEAKTSTVYLNKKGLVFTKKVSQKVVAKRKTTLTKKRKAMVLLYKWGVRIEEMSCYTDIQRLMYTEAEKQLAHLTMVEANNLFIFFNKGKPVYTVDLESNHISDVDALRAIAKQASQKPLPKPVPQQQSSYRDDEIVYVGKGSEEEPPL